MQTTLISLLAASLLALAGSQHSVLWFGIPVFVLCIAIAFIIQWIVFIPAYIKQTERYYDLTGSLTYLSLVVTALTLNQQWDIRVIAIAVMVSIWAVRLGSFLFLRISKDGSDSRFDKIKPHAMRFFTAWTLQGLWVAMTLSCSLAALTSTTTAPIGWLGVTGIVLWILGFVIEVVADYQKRVFRSQQTSEDHQFIHSGLWAYSRHPNYFGEILLWIGISLVALPVLNGWQYITLISPLFVFLLLTRISGIPLLEKSADKRWQNNPYYKQYKAQTPVLIPSLTKFQLHRETLA